MCCSLYVVVARRVLFVGCRFGVRCLPFVVRCVPLIVRRCVVFVVCWLSCIDVCVVLRVAR